MEQAFVQQIKEKIETARAAKADLLKWKQEKIDQLAELRNQKLEGSREYQHIQLLSETVNQKIRAIDETTNERERFQFIIDSILKEPRHITTIRHKGAVRVVAWSPDGFKIATGVKTTLLRSGIFLTTSSSLLLNIKVVLGRCLES